MDVVASIGEERHYNLLMRESVNRIKNSSGQMTVIMEILQQIGADKPPFTQCTIEVARAGRDGQSVSVVATQISALSGKTKISLGEIDDLIMKSSEEVNQGIMSIDSSSRSNALLLDKVNGIIGIIDDIYDHMVIQGDINRGVKGDTERILSVSEEIKKSVQIEASVIDEIVNRS